LCAGSRWFDIRFSQKLGGWNLFHSGNSLLAGYSVDIYTAMGHVTTFLDDPFHSHEVMFWRIKPDTGSDTDQLASIVRSTLGPYALDNPTGNASLPLFTLNEIWKNSTRGTIILFSDGWTAPPVQPGQNKGWFWDYDTFQQGDYSDAYTMSGMLTKCGLGQFPKLITFKEDNNSTDHILFGMWWTFTTRDIQTNTASQWSSYPNAFNDFFVVNSGEIGNFVLSDFFGDYQQIMQVVWDYNFNKFTTFPPRSPIYNRTVLGNPALPGTNILTNPNACDSSGDDNATASWTNEIIAITVVVILVIFFVLCILPCLIYCCYKRKQRKGKIC